MRSRAVKKLGRMPGGLAVSNLTKAEEPCRQEASKRTRSPAVKKLGRMQHQTPRSALASRPAHIRDLDPHRGGPPVALDPQIDRLADAGFFQGRGQIGEPPHRLAVHTDDDVARLPRPG